MQVTKMATFFIRQYTNELHVLLITLHSFEITLQQTFNAVKIKAKDRTAENIHWRVKNFLESKRFRNLCILTAFKSTARR